MSGAEPSAVHRLATALIRARDPYEIADALADAGHEVLGADAVHVSEISQDRAVASARGYRYEHGGRVFEEYVQVIDDRPSGVARVLATGDVVHRPDARISTEVRRDYVERFQIASALYVPVAWNDEVRWVLILLSSDPREFTPAEIRTARVLADQAAAGFARIDDADRLAAQRGREAAFMRAASALNSDRTRDEILEDLAREADLATGGDMAGVYLGDATSGGRATAGHQAPEGWKGYVIKPGEGVGGQVLASGHPVITNAYQQEVRLPSNPGLQQLQTAVSVPVRDPEGALIGALSVGFSRMRRVTADDIRLLEAFANLVAAACRAGERS